MKTHGISTRVLLIGLVALTTGCQGASADPPRLEAADLHEGGRLYDNIWSIAPPDGLLGDHPLWQQRPDLESSDASGSATWRCKTCHGWDYAGVDGAFGAGPSRTGIAGILGTTRTADEVAVLLRESTDVVENGHGYGLVLGDREIWDLTKFVLEGVVDTRDIIDDDGRFVGDPERGEILYLGGMGQEPACGGCHGTDGLDMPHVDDHGDETGESDAHDESVGGVATGNPWEFHHKARFGHPGTPMHGYQRGGAMHQDIADLGAYAQTLPGE